MAGISAFRSDDARAAYCPTASVKRTSRDTGCARIGDLHLHPKCPVVQL